MLLDYPPMQPPTILRNALVSLLVVLAALVVANNTSPAFTTTGQLAGDAARGKLFYENTCSGCHSIDQDRIGPRHRNIVGRRIASIAGFEYSPALRRLKGTWDEDRLDDWLSDPRSLAPGTGMGFRVEEAQDRADVIAYLKQVSAPVDKPAR